MNDLSFPPKCILREDSEALLSGHDYPSSDRWSMGGGGNFWGVPQITPHIWHMQGMTDSRGSGGGFTVKRVSWS